MAREVLHNELELLGKATELLWMIKQEKKELHPNKVLLEQYHKQLAVFPARIVEKAFDMFCDIEKLPADVQEKIQRKEELKDVQVFEGGIDANY